MSNLLMQHHAIMASLNSVPQGNFVRIGNHNYPYVQINNKLWLAENLDLTWDGLHVGEPGDSYDVQRANYYQNNPDYGVEGTYKCGLYYNWVAMRYLEVNKSTLLPEGWHIPTATEYTALTNYVGAGNHAKMKAKDNSIVAGFPNGWNGTDDFEFKMLPAGNWAGGGVSGFGNDGAFWLYDEWGSTSGLASSYTKTNWFQGSARKDYQLNIRLVKDA